MLDRLIESRPSTTEWRHAMPVASASTVAHLLVLVLWFWSAASGALAPAVEEQPRVSFVGIADATESARPVAAPAEPAGGGLHVAPKYLPGAGGGPVASDRPAGFQELRAPNETQGIPAPDSAAQSAVKAADFSGRGVIGGVAGGKPPEGQVARSASELAASDTGRATGTGGGSPRAKLTEDAVDISMVEEQPALLNGTEMTRVLRQLFPRVLLDGRVEGQTTVEFIVGVDGKAELASVRIVASSNDLFAAAARQAVARMVLSPAKMHWHDRAVNVRCRVQVPLVWTVR